MKELVGLFGVSRQAISRKMTPSFRSKYVNMVAGRLQVTKAGATVLAEHFGNKGAADDATSATSATNGARSSGNSSDVSVEALIHQLEAKDKEISRLLTLVETQNRTIGEQNRLIDQGQKLQLGLQVRDTKNSKQMVHKPLEGATKDATAGNTKDDGSKRGFWARIFGRH